MDPELAKIMEKNTPALNRDLADGLAVKHLAKAEAYIDAQIRSVAKYFPAELQYCGFRRCTPQEEYKELTRRKTQSHDQKSRSVYNLARSDTYLVAYIFKFENEEIVRYIALPFLNQYGNIHISGVRFIISPVLCDKIISIGVNDIFVKLNLSKIIFKSDPHYYIANENREMVQVVHSDIYHRSKKNRDLPRNILASTTMMHYLLCRYGFTKTMHEFAQTNFVIGESEINPQNYPEDKYVICSSLGLKPTTLRIRGETYHPSNIRLAIPVENYTAKVKGYIAAFFYIVDHWPQRIRVCDVDEERLWKQLLGELIWGNSAPIGRLEKDSEVHLESLDNYIDVVMKYKFERINMPVDNIYQLFAIMIDNFNDWLLKGSPYISSMYNKELDVLYYVLSDVCNGINNFYFKLKNIYNKKKGKLDIKEVRNIFNQNMKPGLIYGLSNTGRHIEVSTISTSCDNKALKTTAMLVPQETTGSAARSKSASNPAQNLHTSIAEVNAYSAINKKDPSGHNRINLCAQINDRGEIVRNEKFRELLDSVQPLLNRVL